MDRLSGDADSDDAQIENIYRSATDILNRESGANPYLLHEKLQDVMGDGVGIVRHADDLKQRPRGDRASFTERPRRSRRTGTSQFNPGWNQAIALRSLLTVSEAVARSALMRRESRGAHTRLDFEGERDEGLEYNVVVRQAADGGRWRSRS